MNSHISYLQEISDVINFLPVYDVFYLIDRVNVILPLTHLSDATWKIEINNILNKEVDIY